MPVHPDMELTVSLNKQKKKKLKIITVKTEGVGQYYRKVGRSESHS